MKTWVRKTLSVGVLAAGALLFSSGVAHADVDQQTWDNNGIGNGIQAAAPVNLGLNVIGNAIGVAGEGNAAGSGGNWFESGSDHKQKSSDNNGVLNGAQVLVPVQTGINITGNAVGALGEGNAAGAAGNSFGGGKEESTRVETDGDSGPTQASGDNNGILNGAQVYVPVNLGANVCGNSIGILGEANAQSVCGNMFEGGSAGTESGQQSGDNNGIANGLQVAAPVTTLVNLSGNSVALLGESNAAAASHNTEGGEDDVKQQSGDNNGIANGAQVAAPVDLGANVCGNALGVLGEANAAAGCGNDFGGKDNGDKDNGGDDGDKDDYLNDDDADDDNYGEHPRQAAEADQAEGTAAKTATSVTEASPVAGLTKGLTEQNDVAGLGGLEILNALR